MSHQLFADDMQFYQRLLKISGNYVGAIDGVWGPQMDAADQAFTEAYEAAKQQLGAFDARSESNIQTLIPSAQREARRFLAKARAGFPNLAIRILSGTRTYVEQDQLFSKGRNGNPGPIVTHARGGESNHNFGIAWDVGIFDGGRYLTGGTASEEKAYRDLAPVAMSPALEWGGDWTSFTDLPHYQMKTGLTLAQVQQRFEAGSAIA
jgi:peptidoglycan L-alanyl-D-glutamate endopeptidase CwlK